jgi:hypothetical protein
MTSLEIHYEAAAFPARLRLKPVGDLAVTWDDLVWAAVTVGRPNRHYVFHHGDAAAYEALFRWSLLRMALQQGGAMGRRLRLTSAAKSLDPSEKGAVNYFLGMTICKLFAAKLLGTPWLLHLDIFGPKLRASLAGRSRPDLVGREVGSNTWHAFECKGRTSPPDASVKRKAKAQANRLLAINGANCDLHVGAITYFRADVLQFYFCDPPVDQPNGIGLSVGPAAWRVYYAPLLALLRSVPGQLERMLDGPHLMSVEAADIRFGIHPAVLRELVSESPNMEKVLDSAGDVGRSEGYHPDGVLIQSGATWSTARSDDEGHID